MNPFIAIANVLAGNLAESLIHNVFWKTDAPIRGCIVYCDLAFGAAEHSGIYIGNNQIIHRNARGLIEAVSIRQFLEGTSAITIYINCDSNGKPIGYEDIASETESMLGTTQTYSLIDKNCHQFCSYCITGDFASKTFTLKQLKREAEQYTGSSQWRAWDLTKR